MMSAIGMLKRAILKLRGLWGLLLEEPSVFHEIANVYMDNSVSLLNHIISGHNIFG